MLVLSRKPGERIMIGENIVVTVVRIGPNNVRLGIDAPAELNIVREELCGNSPVHSGAGARPEARESAHVSRTFGY